jgi:hypothetical protein
MRKYQVKGTVYIYDKASGKMVEKPKPEDSSRIELLKTEEPASGAVDRLMQELAAANQKKESESLDPLSR